MTSPCTPARRLSGTVRLSSRRRPWNNFCFPQNFANLAELGMVCREPSRSSSTRSEPADIILTNQDYIVEGDRPSITNSESEPAEPTGPGRPGWLPTQVPHRSGLAHHAHPVPHLMNSRPARSVVGTWTWFRSRCTCQVSLQRLMRRHPLPLTGFLGLVPPLQRYYEVLRLPAAHFAALRFLRLAIPSLRPWFVPPGPGRGAVDQSGVGRRYLQPPCSMETTGSPKFPEVPL